ncbi:hypothetical protein NW762_002701 [Fusarium torreyae]|uniref:NADP-dependent oxidoreductase domain-containing protein n=1 Tax=Fusarium torreyae TaxID=1237075 RepID=A0A9W8SAB4_9HYPO|nr:hypothetical protein NW762_002701 [Fusarium torreyae]
MATTLTVNDRVTLQKPTISIPRIGFGSYKIRGQACTTAVLAALSAGYRHIDSAALYRNEERVHNAIEQSGLAREDLFITTKVGSPRKKTGSGEEYQDVIESVNRIAGVDGYVDLLLMHIPGPSRAHRQRTWAAMERAMKEGRAKSIGVSNFRVRHIEELKEYATEWPPSVNQIEGWVPLPKSSKPARIHENIDVFDFALEQDDMESLDGLDEGSAGAIFRMNVDQQ